MTRASRCLACFALLLLCFSESCLGQEIQYMSLDDIKPGMKGKARSVFSGSKIEEFDVEILGVLRNWRPGGDIILARASGPQVDFAGIPAGMSGSPVYVEGKLIGAMAYTWSFSKEPVTGITPIGEMLELEKGAIPSSESKPAQRKKSSVDESKFVAGTIEPIQTPVLVSGFHPAVLRVMEEEVGNWNMLLAQTGGAGKEAVGDTILPGAAMAAVLVSGDGTLAAIGTVTAVDGKKVIGFGHGLSLGGRLEIPLSTAYVHTVIASIAGSMKLASPLRTVGTIIDEGPAGVTAELGAQARLIPVQVSVRSGNNVARAFHFDVADNKLLTSSLVGWAASNAAMTQSAATGEMTIEAITQIVLSDSLGEQHEVKYSDVFFATDPAGAISRAVSAPVDVLIDNRFEPVHVKKIDCSLRIERVPQVVSIDEIAVRPEEVAPGDSVSVFVKLKPFRGSEFSRVMRLMIPVTCDAERVGILVCSAPQMRAWEEQATNRRLPPTSLGQMISQVESSGRGNRLECVISEQNLESGVDGRAFPSPPASFSNVLSDISRSGSLTQTRFGILDSAKLDTEYAVVGFKVVGLRIKH